MAGLVVARSPGRLLDPLPVLRTQASKSLIASARMWVQGIRDRHKNSRAEGRVMTEVPEFRLREFHSEQAPDSFRAFIHAYSRADVAALERLCTPSMAAKAIKGVEREIAATGGVRGVEVGSSLAAPEATAIRTWHPHDAQGTAAAPLVGQVTVRMTWQMSPTFHAVLPRATTAGMLASGLRGLDSALPSSASTGPGPLIEAPASEEPEETKAGEWKAAKAGKRKVKIVATASKRKHGKNTGPKGTTSSSHESNLACVGTWWPAIDSASGHVFYFNDLTGAKSWVMPAVLGLVEPSRPFDLADLGVEAEPFRGVAPPGIEGAGLAASAAQEGASDVADDAGIVSNAVRLVTHVTFERLLAESARDRSWRVAGLL